MAWKTGGNQRIFSEINVTPFADVMLVLLAIFMVTTPLIMVESLKIKLPKASSATAEAGGAVVVSISRDGTVALNGAIVGFDGLDEAMEAELGKGDSGAVLIKADAEVRHAAVVRALDMARRAGARKISIATTRQ